MRITARVRQITGLTKHTIGTLAPDGSHIVLAVLPPPAAVIIEDDGYGFPVLLVDERGIQVADEWFPTLAEAKAQALSEFGIVDDDWEAIAQELTNTPFPIVP